VIEHQEIVKKKKKSRKGKSLKEELSKTPRPSQVKRMIYDGVFSLARRGGRKKGIQCREKERNPSSRKNRIQVTKAGSMPDRSQG